MLFCVWVCVCVCVCVCVSVYEELLVKSYNCGHRWGHTVFWAQTHTTIVDIHRCHTLSGRRYACEALFKPLIEPPVWGKVSYKQEIVSGGSLRFGAHTCVYLRSRCPVQIVWRGALKWCMWGSHGMDVRGGWVCAEVWNMHHFSSKCCYS